MHGYEGVMKPIRGKRLRVEGEVTLFGTEPMFSRAEARHIAACAENLPGEEADTASGEVFQRLIPPTSEFAWMYDVLWDYLRRAAKDLELDVTGIYEPAVMLSYGPGQQNEWHQDFTAEDHTKIGLTVLLNDFDLYEGGDFEIMGEDAPVLKSAGAAIYFAGHLPHRVLPVVSGVRKVLVVWAGGPPFK